MAWYSLSTSSLAVAHVSIMSRILSMLVEDGFISDRSTHSFSSSILKSTDKDPTSLHDNHKDVEHVLAYLPVRIYLRTSASEYQSFLSPPARVLLESLKGG